MNISINFNQSQINFQYFSEEFQEDINLIISLDLENNQIQEIEDEIIINSYQISLESERNLISLMRRYMNDLI